jgi:hypothetical protein
MPGLLPAAHCARVHSRLSPLDDNQPISSPVKPESVIV